MYLSFKKTKIILFVSLLLLISIVVAVSFSGTRADTELYTVNESVKEPKKFIKWVNFDISSTVLEQAMKYDIESQKEPIKLDWIELLSYAAVKNGGNFSSKRNSDIDKVVKRIKDGESMESITKDMKHYPYYHEAYTAVLSEFLGNYSIEVYDENSETKKKIVDNYGLKAFSPIARGFGYSHCSDFGNGRSYGFNRKHLGNDLMGSVGTPIVAVEGGIIEVMGWNRYGGWRIGIRSYDSKRYYYYAHLRKDHPYNNDLKEGMEVKAGDVIGYLGMTGYSDTENVNGMRKPHLHFGMQLIFDESQKEGNNEIWVDVYQIVKLLQKNRSKVEKNPETKEYKRVYQIFP